MIRTRPFGGIKRTKQDKGAKCKVYLVSILILTVLVLTGMILVLISAPNPIPSNHLSAISQSNNEAQNEIVELLFLASQKIDHEKRSIPDLRCDFEEDHS